MMDREEIKRRIEKTKELNKKGIKPDRFHPDFPYKGDWDESFEEPKEKEK